MSVGGQDTTLRLVTLGAALLGGALAANLQGLGFGVGVLVVGVAAVIGWVIATLLTTEAPPDRHRHSAPPAPAAPPGSPSGWRTTELRTGDGWSRYPDRSPPTAPGPPPTGETVQADWWERTPSRTAAPDAAPPAYPEAITAGSPYPPATAALSSRPPMPTPPPPQAPAEATVVAQCPRCGGFRLDLQQAGPDYEFRCRDCGNLWRWVPGTPWPPVVVRRDLDERPSRPGRRPTTPEPTLDR